MQYIPDHGHFLIAEDDTYIGETHVSYWDWDGHVDRSWVVDSAFEPINGQFPTLEAAAGAIREAWEHRFGGCGA